ncbi:hypothetical protein KFE25_007408 [Diacronema lutheri]|uniref:Uncharacterized protein n=1 Tax=Diacronema lutheri TaxID=2081491 RepID=A0A8J6CGA8_DIALT|nr:hypothetical protein KFE25_007408 [Diacronema lutheri]
MPDVGVSVHSVAFITSIAAFVVGIIHLWLSFEGTDSNLKWAKRNEGNHGFISEVNQGWQEAFELTPQAIVDHFQPVLIGWFSLAHHIRYVNKLSLYGSWLQMCLWYVFVALFGCFGYAGSLGIIAGALALVTAVVAGVMVFVDQAGEPRPVLF